MAFNPTVAAGHYETANAASEILKIGGNAVDAAIAATFASFVAEPCMSSVGGGAFANVLFNKETRLYDFFCQTPLQKRPVSEVDFFPITVDFGDTTEDFHVGKGSIAVPGMIAGIFQLHRDYGSIPMQELVQPAIDLAKNGVKIVPFQHLDFQLLIPILELSDISKDIYFNNNELKNIGESHRMPEMADFFEYIAKAGEAAFYKGEIAQKIAEDQARNGGYLTRKDFEEYQVLIRKPLQFQHGNYQILTNPLPSTGGSLMALMLMNLEKKSDTYLDENYILNLLKTLKKVQNFGKLPNELAVALTRTLQKNPSKHGSTTHFNIVDKDGNAVSLTSTNGEGSGTYIENTQVQLNNMLGEAALVPEGFHNWRNDVRLSSMMAPTLVLDAQNEFKAALGSGGAGRIPSMLMQVLHKLIDYNLKPSLAIESPRVHLINHQFNIEKEGFEVLPDVKDLEEELIFFKKKSIYFGGVHSIINKNGKLTGIGDTRREGVAI